MVFGIKFIAFFVLLQHILFGQTDANTCSDVQSYCSYWKNAGYCASSHRFYGYMNDNCKKTCGFCKVDPCEKIPCQNGGTCSPNGDTFICRCKAGYDGNTCEKVNPCAAQPCKNGGSCTRKENEYSCKCTAGFEGKNCENKVITSVECKNTANYEKQCPTWKNAGFCKPGNKWFGFMGDHCAKFCGLCKPKCKDEQSASYCTTYKGYCKHPQYGAIISKSCKKTCNACGGSDPPCGSGPDKLDRVVGGTDAQPNDWPWQALLTTDGKYYCGGTLIRKQWVLTAGHCLRYKTKEQLGVILGDHIRSKNAGIEQNFKVVEIVRHPDYKPETKDSDIALLKLDRQAKLDEKVGLACLPTEPPVKHQDCWITGWGRTQGLGQTSDILQEAKLRTVTNQECSILNTSPKVTPNMLCAGYGLDFSKIQSGCQGDSGGPLVCKKGLKWYVHGAVSWGSSRCISGESYTVFARVTKFTDWIKKTVD